MKPQTILDCMVFQLTPTRTRCELYVVAGDVTEKLSSGLLKPFLSHLQTAEEQLAKGGYALHLEPPGCQRVSWFTKGTAERFVRFVSTPEVLERATTVETELMQLEETIQMQTLNSTRADDVISANSPSSSSFGEQVSSPLEKPVASLQMRQSSNESSEGGVDKNSKKQLLKALDARRLVLNKEQGMVFARAAAAGFDLRNLMDLIAFSDYFGAVRLREACFRFVALCKKRQVTGFGAEDIASSAQNIFCGYSSKFILSMIENKDSLEVHAGFKTMYEGPQAPLDCSLHGTGNGDEHSSFRKQMLLGYAASEGLKKAAISDSISDVSQFKPSFQEEGSQKKLHFLHVRSSHDEKWDFIDQTNGTEVSQVIPVSHTTGQNNHHISPEKYWQGVNLDNQEGEESLKAFMTDSHNNGIRVFKNGAIHNFAEKTGLSPSQGTEYLYMSDNKAVNRHQDIHWKAPRVQKLSSKDQVVDAIEETHTEGNDSCSVASLIQKKCQDQAVPRHAHETGSEEVQHSWNAFSKKGPNAETLALDRSQSHFKKDGPLLMTVSERQIDVRTDVESLNSMMCSDGIVGIEDGMEKGKGHTASFSDVVPATSNLKGDHAGFQRAMKPDDSFDQAMEDSTSSKLKRRLAFHDAHHYDSASASKTMNEQEQQALRSLDDSLLIHKGVTTMKSSSNAYSEMHGDQIYDMIPDALPKAKANVFNQQPPDDLLIISSREGASAVSPIGRMDIDLPVLESTAGSQASKADQSLRASEPPSKERVKRFLDQYNEKREARLRNEPRSKKAEREANIKAMQEDLEKRKAEMGKTRRSDKQVVLAEAQLRAAKLRAYKASLQKTKRQKEEEERKRLEEMKQKRLERIAARSNSSPFATPSTQRGLRSQLSTPRPSPALKKAKTSPGGISTLSSNQTKSSLNRISSDSNARVRAAMALDSNATKLPLNSSRHILKDPETHLRHSLSYATERRQQAGRLVKHAVAGSESSGKASTLRSSNSKLTTAAGSQLNAKASHLKQTENARSRSSEVTRSASFVSEEGKHLIRRLSATSATRKGRNSATDLKTQNRATGQNRQSFPGILRGSAETKGGKTFLRKGSGSGSGIRTGNMTKATKDSKVQPSHVRTEIDAAKMPLKERSSLRLTSEAGQTTKVAYRGLKQTDRIASFDQTKRILPEKKGETKDTRDLLSPHEAKKKADASIDVMATQSTVTKKGDTKDNRDHFSPGEAKKKMNTGIDVVATQSPVMKVTTSAFTSISTTKKADSPAAIHRVDWSRGLEGGRLPWCPPLWKDIQLKIANEGSNIFTSVPDAGDKKCHPPTLKDNVADQASLTDPAKSRLMLFDKACAKNYNTRKHSVVADSPVASSDQILSSTVSPQSVYPKPDASQAGEVSSSKSQTPVNEQSTGFRKLFTFGLSPPDWASPSSISGKKGGEGSQTGSSQENQNHSGTKSNSVESSTLSKKDKGTAFPIDKNILPSYLKLYF